MPEGANEELELELASNVSTRSIKRSGNVPKKG